MSIAALLKNFGIHVPRYVTMNGQIVLGGVTASGSGFVHAEHGPVTPVASHTFHGGVAALDDDAATTWWNAPAAISRHVDAMAQAFPGFEYVEAINDDPPYWVGPINTGRGTFNISVTLRRDSGLPIVNVLDSRRLGAPEGRRWRRSPHLYDNDSLCIADRDDWRADEHTAATATAWAAHWLAAYTEWRITRHWPVEGVHNAA